MSTLQDDKEKEFLLKAELIFKPLNSAKDLQSWMYLYFDIMFPMGTVYPGSTHGPADAMWRIYELYQTGGTKQVPQVVMMASRDSYKTLSAAAIEVLLFLHFKMPICHAAAIKFQSGAAVNYINSMFRKIRPFLEHHGWKKTSENKTLIEWQTDKGEDVSITILTASPEGFNSRHVPCLCLDELDLMDPAAFAESRMVPSVYKGIHPLTIILSTRKYAGGLMEKQVDETPKIGGEVLAWNIIDVAQRIPDSDLRRDLPMVTRYVTSELPMDNVSEDRFLAMGDKDKERYEKLVTYQGIFDHPLLPVMKNYLADRPVGDIGFLHKPVEAVLNNFKVTPIDMANAQLLCKKPSSAGLVYPRFDILQNVLSVEEAYFKISGDEKPGCTITDLRNYLISIKTTFMGGMDFGFTDYTSIVVFAILPTGEVWIVDSFLQDKLELDDIVKASVELDTSWGVDKWYVDQAYPAYVKTLKRAGLSVPEFTKNVQDGISAVQFKVCDSQSKRKFFIVAQPNTQHIPDCFTSYSWEKDRKGDPIEGKPHHDDEYISDVMDSIRYPMQVLFTRSKVRPVVSSGIPTPPTHNVKISPKPGSSVPSNGSVEEKDAFNQQITDHIYKQTGVNISGTKELGAGPGKKGKIFWSK